MFDGPIGFHLVDSFARLYAAQDFFKVTCVFILIFVTLGSGSQIRSYVLTELAGTNLARALVPVSRAPAALIRGWTTPALGRATHSCVPKWQSGSDVEWGAPPAPGPTTRNKSDVSYTAQHHARAAVSQGHHTTLHRPSTQAPSQGSPPAAGSGEGWRQQLANWTLGEFAAAATAGHSIQGCQATASVHRRQRCVGRLGMLAIGHVDWYHAVMATFEH